MWWCSQQQRMSSLLFISSPFPFNPSRCGLVQLTIWINHLWSSIHISYILFFAGDFWNILCYNSIQNKRLPQERLHCSGLQKYVLLCSELQTHMTRHWNNAQKQENTWFTFNIKRRLTHTLLQRTLYLKGTLYFSRA